MIIFKFLGIQNRKIKKINKIKKSLKYYFTKKMLLC
jgi:hypothetical protein